jgi:hypothetical protein
MPTHDVNVFYAGEATARQVRACVLDGAQLQLRLSLPISHKTATAVAAAHALCAALPILQWPATVHGAYMSGVREARRIAGLWSAGMCMTRDAGVGPGSVAAAASAAAAAASMGLPGAELAVPAAAGGGGPAARKEAAADAKANAEANTTTRTTTTAATNVSTAPERRTIAGDLRWDDLPARDLLRSLPATGKQRQQARCDLCGFVCKSKLASRHLGEIYEVVPVRRRRNGEGKSGSSGSAGGGGGGSRGTARNSGSSSSSSSSSSPPPSAAAAAAAAARATALDAQMARTLYVHENCALFSPAVWYEAVEMRPFLGKVMEAAKSAELARRIVAGEDDGKTNQPDDAEAAAGGKGAAKQQREVRVFAREPRDNGAARLLPLSPAGT